MSVKIRLAKYGKKFAPAYKIVVADSRVKRSGKFIDILGFYNPTDKENNLKVDKKLMNKWVENGAEVTQAVKDLVDGKYKYVPYNPKKAKKDAETAAAQEAEASAEAVEETKDKVEESVEEEASSEPEQE